jgi:glycosyltransferase involved in cell wall biosynthesis
LSAFLRSFDILVVPSRLDGRPVVVLEALASGVPVLASRVGALPELIEDGINGFLQAPEDAEAFVRRLSQLAGDRPLLARMKAAARCHAERHLGEAAMLRGYEGRLRGLVESVRGLQCEPGTVGCGEELRQDSVEIR